MLRLIHLTQLFSKESFENNAIVSSVVVRDVQAASAKSMNQIILQMEAVATRAVSV